MPKTSLMMIHNCWTLVIGNSKELRKTAEDMDKIAVAYKEAYLAKVNITEEKLNKLLDEETYLTADECIEMGFADEIVELQVNSSINQNANTCLYNLVNKVKQLENQKTISINLDKETAVEMAKQIGKEMAKGSAKQEPKNNKKAQITYKSENEKISKG